MGGRKKGKYEIEFNCRACGSCCAVEGFVHVKKSEMPAIAEFLKMDLYEFKKKYVKWVFMVGRVFTAPDGGSCAFFKNNKCTIYPVRPEQCRTFPYWDSVVNDESEIKYVMTYCPGVKFKGR